MIETIWPSMYSKPAKAATLADRHTNEIFFIMRKVVPQEIGIEHVVGITGFFLDLTQPKNIYLRWTGIIPSERRKGVTKDAMDILIKKLRIEYPAYEYLIELVPDNEYGKTVALPFFSAYGFKPHTEEVPKGEDDSWNCIPYAFRLCGSELVVKDIHYGIKAGDIVESPGWYLTELIVVDVNWALKAAAIKLGKHGSTVVWPVENLRKI